MSVLHGAQLWNRLQPSKSTNPSLRPFFPSLLLTNEHMFRKPRVTLPHHQSSLSSISAFSTGGGDSAFSVDEEGFGKEPRSRRKSVNHTSLSVVTTGPSDFIFFPIFELLLIGFGFIGRLDEIRPDWESKLEAVKAVAARRANRRIVMRQVSVLVFIGLGGLRC